MREAERHGQTISAAIVTRSRKKLKDISPYNYRDIRPELLKKILRKIDQPEEKIRYWWVQKLIHEYNYDSRQIDIEVPAGIEADPKRPVRADIVVYRDFARTEAIIEGEVEPEGQKEDIAKANALHLLKALYQTIIIPKEVKIETVNRGKQEGAPDALQIETAIKEGWIKTKEIKPNKGFLKAAKIAGLQKAEATVIQYAYQKQAIALLDDEPARIFAKTLGVTVRGSLGILLEATKRQIISREKALETLDKLSETMYLSAELYKLIRKNM